MGSGAKTGLGRVALAILVGALAAGALDFAAACAIYKASPEIIGKAIAAGVLGREASFAGGIENSYLGAGLHFFISLVAAGIYVVSSLRFPVLRARALIGGIVFGLCVFLAMNFIVVPLSAARGAPFDLVKKLPDLGAHLFLFGPAVSLAARAFVGRG